MKIICVARNYVEHAREMDSQAPGEPVFFLKPETALLRNNEPFYYPDFSKDIHYEVELVVRINKMGKHIPVQFAHRYYDQIGIGIDFTARDVQRELKKAGLPWTKAKAFDFSAPVGNDFLPKTMFDDVQNINFRLDLNGRTVQKGNSRDMIFSIDQLISYISQFITLKMGDLIFTGTPQGVGSVKIGDRLQAYIENHLLLDFEVK